MTENFRFFPLYFAKFLLNSAAICHSCWVQWASGWFLIHCNLKLKLRRGSRFSRIATLSWIDSKLRFQWPTKAVIFFNELKMATEMFVKLFKNLPKWNLIFRCGNCQRLDVDLGEIRSLRPSPVTTLVWRIPRRTTCCWHRRTGSHFIRRHRWPSRQKCDRRIWLNCLSADWSRKIRLIATHHTAAFQQPNAL